MLFFSAVIGTLYIDMLRNVGCKFKKIKKEDCCAIRTLHYPTRLVDIRFKQSADTQSKTTISIIFDGGWQIDMRLHNADSKVKITGLKFDVQLAGQPNDIYQQQRSWFE